MLRRFVHEGGAAWLLALTVPAPLSAQNPTSVEARVKVLFQAFDLNESGWLSGRELAAWEHYLHVGVESRVFGRVLLWGATVEGVHGWRAACARPVEIFVPSAVTEPTEGLEAYGVPVHVLEPLELAVPV